MIEKYVQQAQTLTATMYVIKLGKFRVEVCALIL